MRALVAVILAMGLAGSPAEAQVSVDNADCANPPSPREGLAACTRLLQSGGLDARARSRAHANRAVFYIRLRQPGPALREANQALAIDPENTPAYVLRGAAREMLGQRAAAIGDYRRALASDSAEVREAASANLRRLGIEPSADRTEPETESGPHIVFRIRNRTGSSIAVAFYSHSRRWCWPSCKTHHPIHDSEVHSYRVNCQPNELVCWGAWRLSDTDRYWGVGFEDSESCQACCYRCTGQTTKIENMDPAR